MATSNHLRTARKPACLGPAPALCSARTSSTPALLAVMLYEDWSTSYSRSFKQFGIKYNLTLECQSPATSVQVQQTLILCSPQRRYTEHRQCEYILQSKAVEGKKEFLTGLRDVPAPATLSAGVRLFVGDYTANRFSNGPAHTAVVLEGKPEGDRPGWLLLVVVKKPYSRRRRGVNAKTAETTALALLPKLPEWLAKLTPEELHAA